jgi:polyhydroxyalkanoate synthesis repressor PhaR
MLMREPGGAMVDEVRSKNKEPGSKVAVVKKYANRRLYNTATSSYVTLDDLSKMVRAGDHFVVYDAKSGEDLTRSILTQIILEEDSKGRNLLPINFLRQVIGFYDDSLRAFLPRYLELSMENFARNQEQIRRYIEGTLGRFFPMGPFEDMARQNMELFQRAATMFTPLPGANENGDLEAPASPTTEADANTSTQIKELNEKIEDLQQQISELVTARREPQDRS